jgi:hypothetical protein
VSYFSSRVGGVGYGAISKQKYFHTHTTHNRDTEISQASHTNLLMITRVSTGGSRRAPRGEKRASRRARLCSARGPRSGRWCLASELPRMPRVTCVNSVLVMIHTCHHSHPMSGSRASRTSRGASHRETRRGVFFPRRRGSRADVWRRRGPEKNDLKRWPSLPC